jgi:hypothetical protein
MKSKPLNDFTSHELLTAQNAELKRRAEKALLRPAACLECGAGFEENVRRPQKFCCATCRVRYWNVRKAQAEGAELLALRSEVIELREEVQRLKAIIGGGLMGDYPMGL